jgi:4-amino-4-deoxy-L-arabinose transferase-like glycosyltransferase
MAESEPLRPERRWWYQVALLFLAGLAVRLAFVALEPATKLRGDERVWTALGLELAAAPPASFDPLQSGLLFYPPLHPYLIGLTYVLGGSLKAFKLLQALLGAALVLAVACVGRRALGAKVGLVVAAFAAFYPELIWYSAHFWSEPLFILLLWWGLERALAADDGGTGAAAAGGLLLGLAALTREIPLYFLPILVAWLSWRRGRQGVVRAAVLAAATVATVAPWTLRNWVQFDAFVPVSTMGGRALWEANAPGDRDKVYAEHDRLTAEESPVAAYRYATAEGLRAIRERQPLWIFEKTIREVAGVFTPVSMALVQIEKRGYGPLQPRTTWLVAAALILPYLAVMLLAIPGLARAECTRPLSLLVLFSGFYLLLHIVVHGHHRFRLALLPIVFILAASTLRCAGAALRPWTPRRRLAAGVLLVALVTVSAQGVAGFLKEPAFTGRPRPSEEASTAGEG